MTPPLLLGALLASLTCSAPPVVSEPHPSWADPGLEAGTLLVLNKTDNTLSFIDPTDGTTVDLLETGPGPHEVALTSDGKLAVVANYGHASAGNSLSVYDLGTRLLVRTIDLGAYRRPHGLQFEGDDRHLIVTCEENRAIVRVDTREGNVVRAFRTEQNASHMVVLSPTAPRAFVANIADGTMTAIDTESGEHLGNVDTGAGAEGIDVTPDGREVWVTNRSADTVTVVDADSLEVLAQIPCGVFPIRIKITPDGKHALVSNAQSGELALLDVAERQEIGRISMEVEISSEADRRLFGSAFAHSPTPIGILIRPDGEVAYIANTNADVVSVVSLRERKVVRRIQTGRQPDGLGWTALPARPAATTPAGHKPESESDPGQR